MIYSKELFEKAQEIIDERRRRAEEQNALRLAAFEKEEPRYRELKQEMIDSVRDALTAVNMDREST